MRLDAIPIKAVVPRLGGVVEQLAFAGLGAVGDHRLQVGRGLAGLLQEFVGGLHIGGMVLVVVEMHGPLGDDRGQGVVGVGQFGEGEHRKGLH